MSNSIVEIEDTKCLFIFGWNPADSHPIIARRVVKAKEKGATIIVCDPRKIETARIADLHAHGVSVPAFLQLFPPRPTSRQGEVAMAAGAIALHVCGSLICFFMALALGLALLAAANPPARALLQRLGAINIFIVFLWCVTPLTTPGTPLAQWGMLTVSAEGVRLALLVSIKSNAIACIFLALVATMRSLKSRKHSEICGPSLQKDRKSVV